MNYALELIQRDSTGILSSENDEITTNGEWTDLRKRLEPLLIVARKTTPFLNVEEEKSFQKTVLHFMNALMIEEKPEDLLHFVDVCSDTSNAVTRQYLGRATKEYALEALTAMMDHFDAKLSFHGPHSVLLKEVTVRVVVLKKVRDFLHQVFGAESEGHEGIDSYKLDKIRMDVERWETEICNRFFVLRALQDPLDKLNSLYKDVRAYKDNIKSIVIDLSLILDNFKMPEGCSRSQVFQLAVDVLIDRSKDHVEVEKIFNTKLTKEAVASIKTVIKVCICFKSTFEFSLRRNKRLLNLAPAEDVTVEKLFGSLSAFISRCRDLLEICYTNEEFLGSGHKNGGSRSTDELSQVTAKYNQLTENIRKSGRKCLDIGNEQLRTDFQVFKSEVHELDYSLLNALKTSFSNFKTIREACDILETFFSVSERGRLRETYALAKEKLVQELIESTVRQKNTLHKRLGYFKKFYSEITIEMLRFKGLMVKEKTLKEEVFGSRFFQEVNLEEIMATDSIMSVSEEKGLKNIFSKIVNQRLEEPITGTENTNLFLIMRSLNYDGLLDVNYKRSFFATVLEAKVLESLGVSIYGNRQSLKARQITQKIEISFLTRLVTDYNLLMEKLSTQEKGLFRNRIIPLERRLWNGIYKITWQSFASVRSWITMCDETILQLTQEVLEYKTVNKAINEALKVLRENTIHFSTIVEAEIPHYLHICEEQIVNYFKVCQLKVKQISVFMNKLESFLELSNDGPTPPIWTDYMNCIKDKEIIAHACEEAVSNSLLSIYDLITSFKAKPMFRLTLSVSHSGKITVGKDFDNLCNFFLTLPVRFASTDKIALKDAHVIKLFGSDKGAKQFAGLENAFKGRISTIRQEVETYLLSLSPLKDFIRFKPREVLTFYHESEVFIQHCENDVHKLREMAEFLKKQQKRVWINIFVLDLSRFVEDHLITLTTWQESFLNSMVEAIDMRIKEAQALSNKAREAFQNKEAMSNEAKVEQIVQKVEAKVDAITKIAEIVVRTDPGKFPRPEVLDNLKHDAERLKNEKKEAIEYFARKKSQDMMALNQSLERMEKGISDTLTNFVSHGPFTLNWKSDEALNELESYLSKILDFRDMEQNLLKDSLELDFEFHRSSELFAFEARVNGICEVWKVFGEWESFQESLLTLQALDSNSEELAETLRSISSKLENLPLSLDEFAELEPYTYLKSIIPVYLDILEVIGKLKNDSLRDRHWKKLCSLCSVHDTGSFLRNRTVEDVIGMLSDKDLTTFLEVVAIADGEHAIEMRLNEITSEINSLEAKFELQTISVISNSAEVVLKLKEISETLKAIQEDPSSEPFRATVDSLRYSVIVSYEKIESLVEVEKRLRAIGDIFSLYGLQTQLGKLFYEYSGMCEGWQSLYASMSNMKNILDFTKEDHNMEIVTLRINIHDIHSRLMDFLKTRTSEGGFPRFFRYFLQPQRVDVSKLLTSSQISSLFPHVKKLLIASKLGNQLEVVGFVTSHFELGKAVERKFPSPIQATDMPLDFVLQSVHIQLRQLFKSDLMEALAFYRQNVKADPSLCSPHAMFIARLINFWNRVQIALSSSDGSMNEFLKWLHKIHDLQGEKVKDLQLQFISLSRSTESGVSDVPDQLWRNRMFFAIERYVSSKVKTLLDLADKHSTLDKVLDFIDSSLKYVMNKETRDIHLTIHQNEFPLGWDESPSLNLLLFSTYVEQNVSKMLIKLAKGQGIVLKGPKGCGKSTSATFLSALLGNHFIFSSVNRHSELETLKTLLSPLRASKDFLIFKLDDECLFTEPSKEVIVSFFQAFTLLNEQTKYFQNDLTVDSPVASLNPCAKVIVIVNDEKVPQTEAEKTKLYLGSSFTHVRSVLGEFKVIIEQSMENFGHEPMLETVQSVTNLLDSMRVNGEGFHLRHSKDFIKLEDEFCYGSVDLVSMFQSNLPLMEALGHPSFVLILKHVLANPLGDEPSVHPNVIKVCKAMNMSIDDTFKDQLMNFYRTLELHDSILMVGPDVPGKTSLWQICAEALGYNVFCFSTVGFELREYCMAFENFLLEIHSAKEKNPAPILLVFDGPFLPSLMNFAVPLIEAKCSLLYNGEILVRTNKIKILIEGTDMHDIDLASVGHFKLFPVNLKEIEWKAILRSRFESLLGPKARERNIGCKVYQQLERHAGVFLESRAKVGFKDDLVSKYICVSNFLLLAKAVKVHEAVTDEELNDRVLFVALFCFSQDLNPSQLSQLEGLARRNLDCFNVPPMESMFEYFYEDQRWQEYTLYKRGESRILERNRKYLKIANLLMKDLTSIDILGPACSGKKSLLHELAGDFSEDLCLPIKHTGDELQFRLLMRTLQSSMMSRQKLSSFTKQWYPIKGNVRVLLDDVNVPPSHMWEVVNFMSKHKQWLFGNGPTTLNDCHFVSTLESDRLIYTNGRNFVLKLSEIDEEDCITIFNLTIGNFFQEFEVEILFHIKRLIRASVAINKLTNADGNRPLFPLQDIIKISHGLKMANKDWQDTAKDLTMLWLHEVIRTYRDGLSDTDYFDAQMETILKDKVGPENIELWRENKNVLFGDFLNVNRFYTELDLNEVKKFIEDSIENFYRSNDDESVDLQVITTTNTARLFCLFRRTLEHKHGHLLLHGTTCLSMISLVKLVCNSLNMRLIIALPDDLANTKKWRPIVRQITRLAGIENIACALLVSATGQFIRPSAFFDSLEALLSVGIDLGIFQKDELQIMLEKEGFLRKIAVNVKKNFHCIIDGFGVCRERLVNFFDITNTGLYETERADILLGACLDSIGMNDLFLRVDDTLNNGKESIRSFNTFVSFFKENFDLCNNCFLHLVDQVDLLVNRIEKSILESEDQVHQLAHLKEINKELVSEQNDIHKENSVLKKEIDELSLLIEQHVKTVSDDLLTISKSKLIVGQEMASNYAVFRNKLDVLQSLRECNHFLNGYLEAMNSDNAVILYVSKLHEIFEVDANDALDKISALEKRMHTISEETINFISDHKELAQLRKDISMETKTKVRIVDALIEAHKRIENLAKVIKMKNAKFTRIEALNKNISKEEEIILKHRKERQEKTHKLADNGKKMSKLQSDIASRLEKINSLEQNTADFKSSLEDLTQLLNVLKEVKHQLEQQKTTLPGTLMLMAAFVSYCGSLEQTGRIKSLRECCQSLESSGFQYDMNFMKLPLQRTAQTQLELQYGLVKQICENVRILDFLPHPLIIIDPLQISIQFLYIPGETGIIYCGDPDFDEEFSQFSKKFKIIIVRHFLFDPSVFQRSWEQSELQRNNVHIYHIVSSLSQSERAKIEPMNLLEFSLSFSDLKSYIDFNLRSLHLPTDKDFEEIRETLQNRYEHLQYEIEQYLSTMISLSDTNGVRKSVSKLRKLIKEEQSYDNHTLGDESDELSTVDLDVSLSIGQSFARLFRIFSTTPLRFLSPLPLKKYFPKLRIILDVLNEHSIPNPSLKEVAFVVVEHFVRDICETLTTADFVIMAIFITLFLYLYDCHNDRTCLTELERVLALAPDNNSDPVEVETFIKKLSFSLDAAHGSPSLALRNFLSLLYGENDDELIKAVSQFMHDTFSVSMMTECNLERLYVAQQSNMFLFYAQSHLSAYEIICSFAESQRLTRPVLFERPFHVEENFWLLEEALFEGTWIVCFALDDDSITWTNYLRFLLEKCATSDSQHDQFRIWIICKGSRTFRALSSMTVPTNCIVLEESQKTFTTDESESLDVTEKTGSRIIKDIRKDVIESLKRAVDDLIN